MHRLFLAVRPDGNFIHRVALVDKSDKGDWVQEARTEISLEDYKARLQNDPLIAMHSFVRERAAGSEQVKRKVINTLKWLIAGVEPDGV